ncbi:MAG: hypothetical protein SFU83_13720 [Meiothermus sp.]|nr:hypothetical protein [Meiothermus sp.]
MMQTKEVDTKNLSAAEIMVLLDPAALPRETLKAAFKEIVALGLLRLEKVPATGRFSAPTTRLHLGSGTTNHPLLLELLGHLRSAMRHGPELHTVLARLQREYGAAYERFKGRHVLPALVAAGLLEPQTRKVLLVFSSTAHRHTALGLRLKGQLEAEMAQARQLTTQLSRQIPDNPVQVSTLIASLGAAVILVPELWPHFGQFNELIRQQEGDGGTGFVYGGWSDTDDSRPDLETGGLDQSFSEMDSSFDSSDGGASDGGGDGGGGE